MTLHSDTHKSSNLQITSLPRNGCEIFQLKEFKYALFEIKNLVSCPGFMYRHLYLKTLYQFAEFCIFLETLNLDFKCTSEFILEILELSIAALKIRQGVLLPRNTSIEDITIEDTQWTYAVFSASLIYGLYQSCKNSIELNEHFYSLADKIISINAKNWIIENTNLYRQWWNVIFNKAEPNNDIQLIINRSCHKIHPNH